MNNLYQPSHTDSPLTTSGAKYRWQIAVVRLVGIVPALWLVTQSIPWVGGDTALNSALALVAAMIAIISQGVIVKKLTTRLRASTSSGPDMALGDELHRLPVRPGEAALTIAVEAIMVAAVYAFNPHHPEYATVAFVAALLVVGDAVTMMILVKLAVDRNVLGAHRPAFSVLIVRLVVFAPLLAVLPVLSGEQIESYLGAPGPWTALVVGLISTVRQFLFNRRQLR